MSKLDLIKPLFNGGIKLPLFIRKTAASVANVGHPLNASESNCGCCGCNFFIAKAHITPYGDDGGAGYALCEACWKDLVPEERLPYYCETYEWWATRVDTDNGISWGQAWQNMKTAVLAGL